MRMFHLPATKSMASEHIVKAQHLWPWQAWRVNKYHFMGMKQEFIDSCKKSKTNVFRDGTIGSSFSKS